MIGASVCLRVGRAEDYPVSRHLTFHFNAIINVQLKEGAIMPTENRRPQHRPGPTIIPLPVYHGDVYGSMVGTMLFPNEPTKADTFAAQHLTKGSLQAYLRAGHMLSGLRQIALFDAIGRGIASHEIEMQELHGQRVGDVVKALWGLICSCPKIASWETAILMVENGSVAAGGQISRATLRAALSDMRRVLHLWGALALRDYQILADPNVGYDVLDDLIAFMTEAMTLLRHLCTWRDGRKKSDTLLADDAFGPWLGLEPHEPRPEWPKSGGIHRILFAPSVLIPVRRPPGRPRGRKNSVQ
jgi:hypothetical protein